MFDVNDEVNVQDLTAVPDTDATLFPAARGVKVQITRAASNTSKDGGIKALSLGLKCIEGIEVQDPEQGTIIKYRGSYVNHGWMDLAYWASPEKIASSDWFKAQKHLIGFKQLINALGLPLVGLKVNDEFLQGLVGKEILVDVVHERETVKDETGKRIPTGTISQVIKNLKKVA